jgi:hypothetical protein
MIKALPLFWLKKNFSMQHGNILFIVARGEYGILPLARLMNQQTYHRCGREFKVIFPSAHGKSFRERLFSRLDKPLTICPSINILKRADPVSLWNNLGK